MKNPEGDREGKRKQKVKRNSQEHEAVIRMQKDKIPGGIPAERVRGGSHNDGRCGISKKSSDAAGREAPGVRVAKSSESRKGE